MDDLLLDRLKVNGIIYGWRQFKVQIARRHDDDSQGSSQIYVSQNPHNFTSKISRQDTPIAFTASTSTVFDSIH